MKIHHCQPAEGGEGIAKALASAQPGDVVLLAPGRYVLSRPLDLTQGVALRGRSAQHQAMLPSSSADLLARAGQAAPAFDHAETAVLVGAGFLGPFVTVSGGGVCIADLAFLAEGDAGGASGDTMVVAVAVQDTLVQACRFDGGGRYTSAVELIRCTGPTVSDCAISGLDGIDRQGSAAVVLASVTQGQVAATQVTGGCRGIAVMRSPDSPKEPSQVDVLGNRCHGNANGGVTFFSSHGRIEANECWDAKSGPGIAVRRDPDSPNEPSQVDVLGNRCHGNANGGIAFFSSHGRVEANECWDARSGPGIAVQRDSKSADAPSQVEVLGNRCHGNADGGIAFHSSHGRIEANECWDAKRGPGIAAQRDPSSPDAPSQVEVLGNRCRGNANGGISFLSSHGRIEANECWDAKSGYGIGVGRDPNSTDAPSQVEVLGNRCHANGMCGIGFLSSHGRIEANECWDAKSGPGIVVLRDPQSIDAPSQVDVLGNRCRGNASCGIAFFSSHGRIEANECWDARSGPGIAVQRDPKSTDAPSQVDLLGNRCRGNANGGISFLSSHGRIEANECWDSKSGHGIGVGRGPDSTDAPSQVEVLGNRCHGNAGGGIAFFSSHGRVEGNECWDAKRGHGIAVQRDPDSPNEPSQVEVLANRFHGNAGDGIAFFSSHGRIEANECWDARSGRGIAVQRDPKSTDAPSQVDLLGNRCHGNAGSGIVFFSSHGRIEANECWDAKSGPGIVVLRDPNSSDAPSQVEVLGNRCHGNAESGIVFFSSHGRIEANECWDARLGQGIAVQRDPKSPDAPSQVEVLGNRCHGNADGGIGFFSSHGRIEANVCADNGGDALHRSGTPLALVIGETLVQRADPGHHLRLRAAAHPLRSWLHKGHEPVKATVLPGPGKVALADALWAAPSAAEQRVMWQAFRPVITAARAGMPAKDPPSSAGRATAAPPEVLARPLPQELYCVTLPPLALARTGSEPATAEAARIRRATAGDVAAWAMPRNLPDGVPVLQACARHWLNASAAALQRRKPAPRWAVALASTDEPGLQDWVATWPAAVNHPDAAAPRVTQVQGYRLRPAPDDPGPGACAAPDRDWRCGGSCLAALALDDAQTSPSGGLRMAADALWHCPARHVVTLGAMVCAAVLVAQWQLVQAKAAATVGSAPAVSLWQQTGNWLSALRAPSSLWGWMAGEPLAALQALSAPLWWLLAGLFLWGNRLLPGRMGVNADRMADWLEGFGIGAALLKVLRRMPWGSAMSRRLMCSPSAQRHWMARRVFGLRWRDRMPWRRPPPAMLVLREVDDMGAAQADELRTLMALAPTRQPLLLVVQMPGLSMLQAGFLDVWAPPPPASVPGRAQPSTKGPARQRPDELWLIHHPQSLRISPSQGDAPDVPADPDGLDTLGRILGWPESRGGHDPRAALGHDLLRLPPHPKVWPIALVVGSTAQAPMQLSRKADGSGQSLAEALAPHYAMLEPAPATTPGALAWRSEVNGTTGAELDECAMRADGLLLARASRTAATRWIGRAGWRQAAAAALRRRFAAEDNKAAPAQGEMLLARMLAAAEHYHLQAALDGLAQASRSQRRQALRHLLAAVEVLEERVGLAQVGGPGAPAKPPTGGAPLFAWSISLAGAGVPVSKAHLKVNPSAQNPTAYTFTVDPRLRDGWLALRDLLSGNKVDDTQTLGGNPNDDKAWRAADAMLAWGTLWRALACYGSRSGPLMDAPDAKAMLEAALSASLPGTTENPRRHEPSAPSSLTVLEQHLRQVAHQLALWPAGQTRTVLETLLAQDWHVLPDSLRELVRETWPSGLAHMALAPLATAADARALLQALLPLAQRPLLVVSALMSLVSADARRWQGQVDQHVARATQSLERSADALWKMVQAVPATALNDLSDTDLVRWMPSPDLPGPGAAAALLEDEEALRMLADSFASEAAAVQARQPLVDDGRLEPQGWALGVHGNVHRVFKGAGDLADIELEG